MGKKEEGEGNLGKRRKREKRTPVLVVAKQRGRSLASANGTRSAPLGRRRKGSRGEREVFSLFTSGAEETKHKYINQIGLKKKEKKKRVLKGTITYNRRLPRDNLEEEKKNRVRVRT